ncbi:MAG: hypothetical protein B6D35_14260 [Candidatus Brocadia sp. UTAMX2]|jgi:hypothetical protein|nr:MAG: hypothetical protein B6D35_14260 [Candidatus Brocadia sp. UTAMX2]
MMLLFQMKRTTRSVKGDGVADVCFVSLFRRPGIEGFIGFIITLWCVACCADDRVGTIAAPVAGSESVWEGHQAVSRRDFPEDYSFDSASILTEPEGDGKKLQFHGYFEVTSPIHGSDDESQQPSSQFLKDNELTLWLGKRISRRLSFGSEIEIKDGFETYELERCEFDYEIMKKLLIVRLGKFKYPLGIERLVESAPLNKLIDRPFPSTRIIPGTYSDIGGMLHGAVPFPHDTRLKYEFALSNGLAGPDHEDVQQLWDNNRNKALGGRLGYEILPGLELGGSYSRGKYDEDDRLSIDFLGADIQFRKGNLEVRGEYITSQVEQRSADGGDYDRNGYYFQVSYQHPFHLNYIRYAEGVFRFDSVDPNRDITDGNEADRIAVGINYAPTEQVIFKIEYEVENEPGEEIHGKAFVQAIFRW